MKIEYREIAFRESSLDLIEKATAIAADYARQGYDLTLRQLYYQFVARGLIKNQQTEYKRLGSVINDARLAGLFDWRYITDRTRNLAGGDAGEWTPAEWMRASAQSYQIPFWAGQDERIEVWVEKEALAGVIGRAANARRVAYFACRGYVSQSELWAAAQRLERYVEDGHPVTVLHLGDHDPSGIDMTRDMRERLEMFFAGDGVSFDVDFRRIALNMDQVRRYNPPPNPAKLTDSRVGGYIARFGDESWELDALDPATLDALIRAEIDDKIDPELWKAAKTKQATERAQLTAIADRWDELAPDVEPVEPDDDEEISLDDEDEDEA